MFGRGQRDELDDEEGVKIANSMRAELAKEVKRIKLDEGISLGQASPSDRKHRMKL